MNPLKRSWIYIDRLINQAHGTGFITQSLSNDFPEMSLVLTIHGAVSDSFNLLWQYASTDLRGELTGRSRSLLQDRQIPDSNYRFSQEERAAIINKINQYDSHIHYLEGIFLTVHDDEIRDSALARSRNLSNVRSLISKPGYENLDLTDVTWHCKNSLSSLEAGTKPILPKETEKALLRIIFA